MDDLISRAAVLRMLDENGVVFRGEIEKLPAVDTVPVVRCRDCKYGNLCSDADGHRLIQCTNTDYPAANVETWPLELDWYCAGGKRRDENAADY